MSLYTELRRRNVFKVAIVYSAVAWLLLQISDTLGPALHLPEWFLSAVAFLLILGFPVAIVFAWAFDLTPDGLRMETKADPAGPEAEHAAKKLNYVVVVALVLALGYFAVDKLVFDSGQDTAAASVKPDNSIAVLPFVNMSSDPEQEYFSDGLSEELLNLLARIPELKVAARTSSFTFKDKDIPIPEIAARLNVAHVLEGSVRKQGNRLRITAQLIQADNGYHLWSETYDKELDNVFEIQEEIALAVTDALRITLLGAAPKVRKTDPEAYQLFLEGQYLKRQISYDSLNRAVDAFERAVEIDPDYAPAWAELADTLIWGGGIDKLPQNQRYRRADEAIAKAISADPDYAYAYYVRGISWIFTKHEFKRGIEDFEHAHELDPNNAFIVAAIGKGAFLTGDFDLAISQYETALKMERLVPEFYYFLGRTYLRAGRLDDAEVSSKRLSDLSPSPRGDMLLFETLLVKGDLEAARANSDNSFQRAVAYYLTGDIEEADKALAELIDIGVLYHVALAYGYRGEVDKTFEWLDMALENDDFYPTWILVDTALYSVYSDPRWEALLERLGLIEFWQDMEPEYRHQ